MIGLIFGFGIGFGLDFGFGFSFGIGFGLGFRVGFGAISRWRIVRERMAARSAWETACK